MKLKVRTQLGDLADVFAIQSEIAKAINLVNLSYKRPVSADSSAVLLNGQKNQRFVSTPVLKDTYQRRQIGRIFYVGIVYLLGPSVKEQTTGFDYDE